MTDRAMPPHHPTDGNEGPEEDETLYRDDVREALETAGWPDPGIVTSPNGSATWIETSDCRDSRLGHTDGWNVNFSGDVPAAVIVAAALTAGENTPPAEIRRAALLDTEAWLRSVGEVNAAYLISTCDIPGSTAAPAGKDTSAAVQADAGESTQAAEQFVPAAFGDFSLGDRIRFYTNDNGYGGCGEVWRTGTVAKVTACTVVVACDPNWLGDRAMLRRSDWSARAPQRAGAALAAAGESTRTASEAAEEWATGTQLLVGEQVAAYAAAIRRETYREVAAMLHKDRLSMSAGIVLAQLDLEALDAAERDIAEDGKDTCGAGQATAGGLTQDATEPVPSACGRTTPHAHHTGCVAITTAEHRVAAGLPGPAAQIPTIPASNDTTGGAL